MEGRSPAIYEGSKDSQIMYKCRMPVEGLPELP